MSNKCCTPLCKGTALYDAISWKDVTMLGISCCRKNYDCIRHVLEGLKTDVWGHAETCLLIICSNLGCFVFPLIFLGECPNHEKINETCPLGWYPEDLHWFDVFVQWFLPILGRNVQIIEKVQSCDVVYTLLFCMDIQTKKTQKQTYIVDIILKRDLGPGTEKLNPEERSWARNWKTEKLNPEERSWARNWKTEKLFFFTDMEGGDHSDLPE